MGVPLDGFYAEVFNSDSARYGGSNLGNLGGKFTEPWAIHGYGNSLDLCLPPLSVLVFSGMRSAARCCPRPPLPPPRPPEPTWDPSAQDPAVATIYQLKPRFQALLRPLAVALVRAGSPPMASPWRRCC